MTEPTTSAAALAAAASGVSLALLGVDVHSLLYAFIGALVAIGQQPSAGSKWRAVASVLLSMLVGAVLGNAAASVSGATGKASILTGCVVGGAGAQVLIVAMVRAAQARIESFGGRKE